MELTKLQQHIIQEHSALGDLQISDCDETLLETIEELDSNESIRVIDLAVVLSDSDLIRKLTEAIVRMKPKVIEDILLQLNAEAKSNLKEEIQGIFAGIDIDELSERQLEEASSARDLNKDRQNGVF